MKKIFLMFLLVNCLSLSIFAVPTEAGPADSQLAASIEDSLTPLDKLKLDLSDVLDFLTSSNDKAALEVLKTGMGNIRKAKELKGSKAKAIEKKYKTAIKKIKGNSLTEAKSIIEGILGELNNLS